MVWEISFKMWEYFYFSRALVLFQIIRVSSLNKFVKLLLMLVTFYKNISSDNHD